ncbi:MAG: cysteine hydrolase family protein [Sumerlaeia bacterium]
MKRALIVIDVQNEYFTGALPISYPADTLTRILQAMDAAQAAGVPVVVVRHTFEAPDAPAFRAGSAEAELHPEIARRPHDLLVEKHLPGSFTNTNLDAWLRERAIDTVVIAGYMSQMCCDTTSREAFHRGYKVEFLSDGTGTLDFETAQGKVSAEELHRAVLVTHSWLLADVKTTDEWISGLE